MHGVKVDGARIRAEREGKGLTQSQVADATGIGRAHLSLVENGKSSLSPSKAAALAELLGLTLEDVYGGSA